MFRLPRTLLRPLPLLTLITRPTLYTILVPANSAPF